MPTTDRYHHDYRPIELVELMAESRWQRDDLVRIKAEVGYQICNFIYKILDKMFCSNLFSYIDERFQQHSHETSSKRPYRSICAHSRLGQSPGLNECATTQEMNSRIFGRARRFSKGIFLSRLLLIYCCCCCLGLLISTIRQYKYDYYVFHLGRFRWAQTAQKVAIYERLNVTEEMLASKLAEARSEVKAFGSFLMNRSYFAQCCYILMTLLTIFTYPGPLLYFHLRGAFDFYYLRLLLDWDQEQRNCNRLVVELVDKLQVSSERFMEISLDEHEARAFGFSFKKERNSFVKQYSEQSQPEKRERTFTDPSLFFPMSNAAAGSIRRDSSTEGRAKAAYANDHQWLTRRLRTLALTGRLQPLDRCDVREMSRATTYYAIFFILVVQSCFIWNVILFTTLPLYFGFSYELDFTDCVSFLELASLNVLLTLGGTFYLSMALVYCSEQGRIVAKLRAMIFKFISKHRRVLESFEGDDCRSARVSICEQQASSRAGYYDELNTDFLLILMHYKIFASQSRPAQRTFGFVLFCSFGLMTIFPIIARLNLPYVHDMESKVLTIIVCFIMLGLPDFSMVPMCWMHSRSLDLFEDLWKLMALIVELGEHPELGHCLNEHSVWLMRKELSHPEHQYNRFAIATLGIKFTYAELLKLHFWLGIVILSFVIELQSAPADLPTSYSGSQTSAGDSILMGGWFSDPLGIISEFKA